MVDDWADNEMFGNIKDTLNLIESYQLGLNSERLNLGILGTPIISSGLDLSSLDFKYTNYDFNIFDEKNIVDTEVDQSAVYMLNITEEVELESQIFDIDQEYEDDQSISQKVQAVVLSPQHDDFDIEVLVRRINKL